MIYTLDTNVCIRIINGRSVAARTRLASVPENNIVICSIVRAELFYGASKSQTPELTRRKQELFLRPFSSLPFDDLAAAAYGSIRAQLEQKGTLVGPMDLLIAAIAVANKLTLVTHNVREFRRISGLHIEDWETD